MMSLIRTIEGTLITNILRKLGCFVWYAAINEASYKFYFFTQFVEIFFGVATFYFLSRLIGPHVAPQLSAYGGDYFSFAILGIATTGYIHISVRAFEQNIRSAQVIGTLEALCATPTSIGTIIAGLGLYSYLWTTLRVAAYVIIGGLLFGLDVSRANIVPTIYLFVLTILAFVAVGILSAAFTIVFKKGNPFAWIFLGGSEVLAGVMYPVDVLPGWMQKISWLFPLTHSLEGLRRTVLSNAPIEHILSNILYLSVFSIIGLPAAVLVFRYAVHHAMKENGLADY